MSLTDQLDTAAFPDDYADLLIETLAVTRGNFPRVRDALYHFRRLDDELANQVMARMLEAVEQGEGPESGPLAACRLVAERWERGDLAEAARACQAAVAAADAG